MTFDPLSLQSEYARTAPVPRGVRLQKILGQAGKKIFFNFDQGQPAPENYPLADLKACFDRVLGDEVEGRIACTYNQGSDQEMRYGDLSLRRELALWMERRHNFAVDPAGVTLVNGSTQGLAIAARAYLGPGDVALVEENTFPYMRNFILQTGAQLAGIPVNDDGMDLDIAEEQLRRLRAEGLRPKMIYVIPTFQVPTSVVMPLDRRRRLLELAETWDLMVVEDNCYYFLPLDVPTPPTLLSMDQSGRVLQSESFSKYVAPGLRMGWLTGTPAAIGPCVNVRQDLGVSNLIAHALAHFVRDGMLDRQLERASAVNQRKRDRAIAALEKYCSPWVKFRKPGGGLYIWLELSDELDFAKVRETALDYGVACRPGEMFSDEACATRFMRMAYYHMDDDDLIEKGIEALGQAMAASVKSKSAA